MQLTDDGVQMIAMDPANVAMISFNLLASSFVTYEKESTEKFTINLNSFKQVLRRIKGGDTLTLEDDENKLKVTLQSSSKRTFHLPLIDVEDREQKVPDLNFAVNITTPSAVLNDAIDDVDVVGESVSLSATENMFTVSSKGDVSQAKVDIPADNVTTVSCTEEGARSKYSIEYLKKMIQGAKLADQVAVRFSKDYPLRLEYLVQNKVELAFVLAPRVDND